jgi:hypothetical protein
MIATNKTERQPSIPPIYCLRQTRALDGGRVKIPQTVAILWAIVRQQQRDAKEGAVKKLRKTRNRQVLVCMCKLASRQIVDQVSPAVNVL